jgi:rhodanese-related sulfurtransferase
MNPMLSAVKNVLWLVVLVGVGVGSGVLANKVGENNTRFKFPAHIPWEQKWTNRVLEEAEALGINIFDTAQTAAALESGEMWIVDGRKLSLYDQGHIPTAISLPVNDFEAEFINFPGLPEEPIVVYCSGANCDESLLLCKKLLEQGFTQLTIYVDGFGEWKKQNLEIE